MVKKAVKRGQIDLWKTASRWQRAWKVQKAFEADANTDRPKFFLTFPYPYVNGQPHIGHLYTFLRVESFARYKRMRGFNVLFPQAWHATGAPIDTAAGRVREKDEVQIKALKAMGIPDEEIPKFVEPMHWIKTFSKAWERDLRGIGASIDWRRNFITTDLNPRYSKFISWQFRTLKKKGFVAKGKHPVVWCPKENVPVGDHARAEGEGEVPQEFLLFKHKLDDGRYLVSATLRPDTTLGITNLFVHPDFEYLEAEVNGEKWIFGEGCLEGLKGQDFKVKITGKVKGGSLIGKKVEEYGHVKVPILPATFLDPKMGTGLVHSVPSDSADDLIALRDLQKDEETCKKYGLDIEEVRRIKPIPILNTPGYGDIAADAMLKKYDVKSQNEREKLEKIKKELYKLSHYTATLNYRYKTAFSENLEGKKVEEAKEIIKNDLVKAGYAVPFYELSGRVVCRCQTECIVKIVSDQWFLKYSLPEWKQLAMKALQECKLYPEKIRPQFEYVIDWLRDWACTREYGMGTSLPWDKKWKIESLSDSTIYMAFYTITHLLKKVSLGKVNDKLFDYVFLGEGNPDELAVDKQVLDQLRHEFTYWYPVDFRNSGKDLVQNHLAFFLLNHVAVFPERFWPRGIGVNGYVSIQKMKMSKSKGIFKTVRELIDFFSPDVVRAAILSTGEDLFDVDWDPDLAMTIKAKLESWYRFCLDNYAKGEHREHAEEKKDIDKWMEHQLHKCIKEATAAMEETLFRTAITKCFFDLQRHLKWYLRRKAGKLNRWLVNEVIDAQTKMLVPFTPHICEEIWSKLGNPSLISLEKWPVFDESKINPALEQSEALINTVVDDVRHVLSLAKIAKPKSITFFVAEDWKYALFNRVKELLGSIRNVSEIIRTVMADPEFKRMGGVVANLVSRLGKDPSKIPSLVTHQEAEYQFLFDAIPFLKQEFDCLVHIVKEQDSKEPKAKSALPGKPALIVA